MIKRVESGISCRGINFDCLLSIKEIALRLGLKGVAFIKHDGSLKIDAEGEEEDLKKFIKKIRKEIPSNPIENSYITWREPTGGEFENFDIYQE